MEQPRVSVIIPCYNAELFIDNSIESVYSQNYRNVELIVVDDGSTDNSCAKIQAWANRFVQKGTVLKYVYQENRGLGGAIDTGLKYVTGEYLSLLDADDVFLPNSIQKRAEFLESHPECVGVRTNGWYVNEESRRLFIASDEEKEISDLFTALSFGRTNNWAGTYLIRTSVLFDFYQDRNIYASRFGQNFQILLPVAYKRKFGYIDEPLMEYRVQSNSLSQESEPNARYQKSLINAAGWRDIYRNVVSNVITDSRERECYLTGYDSVFYRNAMNWAIAHGCIADARQNYALLKQMGYLTLNDRINFTKLLYPPISLGLRVIRKMRSLVGLDK